MALDKVFKDVLVFVRQGRCVPWLGPDVCQHFGPCYPLLDLLTQGAKGSCVRKNLTPVCGIQIGSWLIGVADPHMVA